MAEDVHDKAGPPRRAFFLAGCLAIGAASVGFVLSTFRFLVPNVLYEPSRRVTVGSPDEYPAGTITFPPPFSAQSAMASSKLLVLVNCPLPMAP